MLQIRENKCPQCGSPADFESWTCSYCHARIPRGGDLGGQVGPLACTVMFVAAIGFFAADWYLGTGMTAWLIDACGQTSDAGTQ